MSEAISWGLQRIVHSGSAWRAMQWLCVAEFAYAVALRGRPGLRFTGTAGAAPTTLLLAFALALRLAPLVSSRLR